MQMPASTKHPLRVVASSRRKTGSAVNCLLWILFFFLLVSSNFAAARGGCVKKSSYLLPKNTGILASSQLPFLWVNMLFIAWLLVEGKLLEVTTLLTSETYPIFFVGKWTVSLATLPPPQVTFPESNCFLRFSFRIPHCSTLVGIPHCQPIFAFFILP